MPFKRHKQAGRGISVLVPFNGDQDRQVVWRWLRRYWEYHLPGIEIIMGHDRRHERDGAVFSKTCAINDAFRRCTGDVIVIADADCYIDTHVIAHCAKRLRAARAAKAHTWFVPYRHIYRLTKHATNRLIRSNPRKPLRFSTPPPSHDIESTQGSAHGHRFGAMIVVLPREAFVLVGGMDPRFRGWGGEDASFVRLVDTLWGKHTNTPNDVLHCWHPKKIEPGTWLDPTGKSWEIREWAGQGKRPNDWLSKRYQAASGDPVKMRALIEEDRNA